jgi:hypothetical protein
MLRATLDINGEKIGTIKIVNTGNGNKEFADYRVEVIDHRQKNKNTKWVIQNVSRISGPLYVLKQALSHSPFLYSIVIAPKEAVN